jgi:hypothetical protein
LQEKCYLIKNFEAKGGDNVNQNLLPALRGNTQQIFYTLISSGKFHDESIVTLTAFRRWAIDPESILVNTKHVFCMQSNIIDARSILFCESALEC